MNLFDELKRRKVIKTIGVYAAAALIIIQVSDIVFPRLYLPEWTITFIIVLVIIGFPLTFFLSWNYNITPDNQGLSEGSKENELSPEEIKQGEKSSYNIYTITGAFLAAIGIGFWFFFSTSSLSTADENIIENSIAVFNFENLSPEDETSRMGEILQHLIISDLSGLTHLKVISSQRLLDLKKQLDEKDKDKYAVAQLANAKVLLSGSIMDLSGKKILVGDLIDVMEGNVIKSHRIEGIDIYSMVDRLTEKIRQDLAISTHKDDQISLVAGTKTTKSVDAYEKYLEGVKYFNDLEWGLAINSFNDAIAFDSTFFDAYFYISISLGWADDYIDVDQSPDEICKIILDKKLYHNEIEKQRVEGTYQYTKGNYNKSLPFFEKLIEIEPDNKLNWYGLGEAYYHIGLDDKTVREENYPKAVASMQNVLDLDPDFHTASYHIFDVFAYNRDWEAMFQLALEYEKNLPRKMQPRVIRAYENLGQYENADKYFKNIEKSLIDDKDKESLCFLNADLAFNLANEDSLFQRAIQYAERGLEICPPNHQWMRQCRFMVIGSTYEIEGPEAGKKAYKKFTNNMDLEEKFDFTWKLGRAIYFGGLNNTKFNLTSDDALYYINIALDLSKQKTSPKYSSKFFTKAIYLHTRIIKETQGLNIAIQKMEGHINEHCGGTLNFNCFAPHEKSSYLGALFYREGAYKWAERIYKFHTETIKFLLIEENTNEDDMEYFKLMLSQSYFRLGMMKLRQGHFDNARQDFYDAVATIPNDCPFDNIWIKPQFIKQRIGECYFKSQNYVNAQKIYRKLFNDDFVLDYDKLGWQYSNLSMLALSEFLSENIDSAKFHFDTVEKKYDDINFVDASTDYYYIDWPLYQFHSARGNSKKALYYLTSAYNHIPEDERKEYLTDDKRLEHIHKYYYIHEIIETYNQYIR